MRVKIPAELAFFICSFDNDKDYESLVRFAPRKKKRAQLKALANKTQTTVSKAQNQK